MVFFSKLNWWLFFSEPLGMKSICDITCCYLIHLKQWTVVLMTSHLMGHCNARFHSYFTSSVTNVDLKFYRLSNHFGLSNWSLQRNITETLNGKQNYWVWSLLHVCQWEHGLVAEWQTHSSSVYRIWIGIHSQLCIMNICMQVQCIHWQ